MKRPKQVTKRQRKIAREHVMKAMGALVTDLRTMLKLPDRFGFDDVFPDRSSHFNGEVVEATRLWQRNIMAVLVGMGALSFESVPGRDPLFTVVQPFVIQDALDGFMAGDYQAIDSIMRAGFKPPTSVKPVPSAGPSSPVEPDPQAPDEQMGGIPELAAPEPASDPVILDPLAELREEYGVEPKLTLYMRTSQKNDPSDASEPDGPAPTMAHDHPHLTDQERHRVVQAEAALNVLMAGSPCRRADLFTDGDSKSRQSEEWQRHFLERLQGAGVIVREGEKFTTRYSAIEGRPEALLADPEWLLRILVPSVLSRHVPDALPEGNVSSELAPDPSFPGAPSGDLSEVQRLLPEFFKILSWQHERITAIEATVVSVDSKLDAVLALLKGEEGS